MTPGLAAPVPPGTVLERQDVDHPQTPQGTECTLAQKGCCASELPTVPAGAPHTSLTESQGQDEGEARRGTWSGEHKGASLSGSGKNTRAQSWASDSWWSSEESPDAPLLGPLTPFPPHHGPVGVGVSPGDARRKQRWSWKEVKDCGSVIFIL